MSDLPALPPGFQLERPPAAGGGNLPPLPAGFQLEAQGQQPGPAAGPQPGQQVFNAGPSIAGLPLNLQNLPGPLGPIAGAMGLAPHVETIGADPQAHYDQALEAVRKSQFPNMDPAKFKAYAAQNLGPYNLTDLNAQGVLAGASDEIGAGMGALGSQLRQWAGGGGPGFGDAFGTLEDLEQARRDLGRQQTGALGTASELVGSLASMGKANPATFAAPASGGFVQTVKNLGTAGAQGAAYGFGATDGDLQQRAVGAGAGALVSAGGAAALPFAARTVQSLAHGAEQRALTRDAIQSAPTAATLKSGAKATIRAAEATGAVIDQGAMNILRHDMHTVAQVHGVELPSGKIPKNASPKAKAALQAIDEYAAQPMDIKQAQRALKAIRRVANDPAEAAIGNSMLHQFESFMDSLPHTAFKSGNGTEAIRLWAQHRGEWAKFKRTDTVEQALNSARYAKGGFANGLRSEFAKILRNPRKQRGFSSDDLHAMDRFAAGGSVSELMGFLRHGGIAPTYLMGHVAGGPIAGAVMAGGKMAGNAAVRMFDNRAARNAGQAVRAQVALPNGLPRPLPPPPPTINGVARRIGARIGNPLLDDQRNRLALSLSGKVP